MNSKKKRKFSDDERFSLTYRGIAFGCFYIVATLLSVVIIAHFFDVPMPWNFAESSSPQELQQEEFDQAVAAIERNNDPDAWDRITELVKLDPPFVPVHEYLIQRMIESDNYLDSSEALNRFVYHLDVLAKSGDEEAKVSMAEIRASQGDVSGAIELLRQVVDSQPAVNAALAKLLVRQGAIDEAHRVSRVAVRHLTQRIEAEPDEPELRLALAESLGILNENDQAIDTLRAGLKQNPGFQGAITEYIVREVDALLSADPTDAEALRRLKQAIKDDPANPAIWSRILRISMQQGEVSRTALELMKDAREGDSSGMVEMVLGMRAFSQGDVDAAIKHFEVAYIEAPDRPDIMNNLAWSLSQADPPRHERALAIADRMVEMNPAEPRYLETRGQILAMMGRNDEAIADLERALVSMPGHKPLRQTLESLYLEEGDPAKANALRESAAETAQ